MNAGAQGFFSSSTRGPKRVKELDRATGLAVHSEVGSDLRELRELSVKGLSRFMAGALKFRQRAGSEP